MPDRRPGVTLDAPGWRAVASILVAAWWVALIIPGAARGPLSIQPRTLAALALLLAGSICLVLGSRSLAVRALAAGVVTLVAAVAPRTGEPPLIGAAAAGVAVLVLPLLLEVVSEVVPSRLRRSPIRTAVPALGVVLAIAVLLTWSALLDAGCRRGCSGDALVPVGWSGRAALHAAVAGYTSVVGLLLAWSCGRGLVNTRAEGPSVGLVAAGGLVAGVAAIAGSALELLQLVGVSDRLGPERPVVMSWLLTAGAAGMGLVALGLVWHAAGAAGVRARVRGLASALEVAPAPGTLATVLAGVLDDPAIQVGYWVPDEARYVDADGEVRDDLGRCAANGVDATSIPIERRGRPIAVVRHRRAMAARDLQAGLGPSALVALDNERLRAVSLHQLRELQSSRRRIVAVADEQRRQIERDLHDGAQQRLLAIAIELRLARGVAESAREPERVAALARVEAEIGEAIETLRGIARGIYPTVLARAGLVAALRSLAAGSPIALEVAAPGVGRLPTPVELAAYSLVSDALVAAQGLGAAWLSVGLDTATPCLTMTIAADTAWDQAAAWVVAAEDRAGAVGGTLGWVRGPDGAVVMEVVLPCA